MEIKARADLKYSMRANVVDWHLARPKITDAIYVKLILWWLQGEVSDYKHYTLHYRVIEDGDTKMDMTQQLSAINDEDACKAATERFDRLMKNHKNGERLSQSLYLEK